MQISAVLTGELLQYVIQLILRPLVKSLLKLHSLSTLAVMVDMLILSPAEVKYHMFMFTFYTTKQYLFVYTKCNKNIYNHSRRKTFKNEFLTVIFPELPWTTASCPVVNILSLWK